jgi:hypothetical protein
MQLMKYSYYKPLVSVLIRLTVLMNLFHSCSKIYDPEIKSDDPKLVIEGFLNNINGESYVKIIKSSPFDSNE